jgi:transcriptional regulator with XRE-family HTH domain
MLMHEAVRKARRELGLSQKRLAELAGIQRRQVATLEAGGNVTLATIRKVIAQLPNLEAFTLDGVKVTVGGTTPSAVANEMFSEAMEMLAIALKSLAARAAEGGAPTDADIAALKRVNSVIQASIEEEREEGVGVEHEGEGPEGPPEGRKTGE